MGVYQDGDYHKLLPERGNPQDGDYHELLPEDEPLPVDGLTWSQLLPDHLESSTARSSGGPSDGPRQPSTRPPEWLLAQCVDGPCQPSTPPPEWLLADGPSQPSSAQLRIQRIDAAVAAYRQRLSQHDAGDTALIQEEHHKFQEEQRLEARARREKSDAEALQNKIERLEVKAWVNGRIQAALRRVHNH